MRKIGILGGMSYESTTHYYEKMNQMINQRLGDLSSAEIILYSVNFQTIEPHMKKGEWKLIAKELCDKAKKIETAGADFIMIATNTMHKLVDDIQKEIHIPILHIADAVAKECQISKVKKVGLIGTKYTMSEDFMKQRLKKNGLEVYVPEESKMLELDNIIFQELCVGKITDASHAYYLKVMKDMAEKYHLEGIILGCTEIQMLVKKEGMDIPIFDTTQAHINAGVAYALDCTQKDIIKGINKTSQSNIDKNHPFTPGIIRKKVWKISEIFEGVKR